MRAMFPVPELHDNRIHLAPVLLPELEIWEIDPAWDGQVFHSRLQARRAKDGRIEASLALPGNAGGSIAVRAVAIDGRRMQAILR